MRKLSRQAADLKQYREALAIITHSYIHDSRPPDSALEVGHRAMLEERIAIDDGLAEHFKAEERSPLACKHGNIPKKYYICAMCVVDTVEPEGR